MATRMHSSRMRTARSLTVYLSCSACGGGHAWHAYPPAPCMPPATHAPYHTPPAMHAPCHTCPLPCTPPLPCMSPCHACPPPCMPPCHARPLPHVPSLWTETLTHATQNITLLQISFSGGKY